MQAGGVRREAETDGQGGPPCGSESCCPWWKHCQRFLEMWKGAEEKFDFPGLGR